MLSMCVLGSGSSGNCTLVRLGGGPPGRAGCRHVLIDAGLSPRETARRLAPLGLGLEDVDDILVTHLDRDHCAAGWAKAAVRHGVTMHVHRRHRGRALRAGLPVERTRLFETGFALDGRTVVTGSLLAHDAMGTVGYVIEHRGTRLGYATDLGRVTGMLYRGFVNLDALALESNYDRHLQLASGRPPSLVRRIMGGLGHLSNDQSLEAVLRIGRQSALRHVVLLHLSRQCNDPDLVKHLYARRAPGLLDRLTITSQHRSTPLLHIGAAEPAALPGQQLALFR